MKILVSWHAYNHDFANGQVLDDGPTAAYHKHFYKHEKHILLSTEKEEDMRALHLRTNFSNNGVVDPTIDLLSETMLKPIWG